MKKITISILILAVLAGIFSPVQDARAQEGVCIRSTGTERGVTPEECPTVDASVGGYYQQWKAYDATNPNLQDPGSENDFLDDLESCGIFGKSSVQGCIQLLFYFLFVTIPSFLLNIAAHIFNFVAGKTITSGMYELVFIEEIWRVLRDLANIFFILILLYAAFQIMLDLGHGGGKKIVASVILIALLVNFSLFFTKVIIDSSNIVALIFYNRIDTTNVSYEPISNGAPGEPKEQDMAGALVSRFNINTFFSDEFMEKLKVPDSKWFGLVQVEKIPTSMLISIMVLYGLIIYALTYAFFVAGMSFLGRMLMLMMLMIVSPLAFVSSTVPKFKSVETIGFDSWIKKLIETSFVAAIFMFIIYIVSEIVGAKIFGEVADVQDKGVTATLIMLFVPALLIVMLLIKGASYAKKTSGQFTEGVISGAKALGGIALGGAALGAASLGMLGRNTIGNVSKYAQNDTARTKALDLKSNLSKNFKGLNKANPFAYVKAIGVARDYATAKAADKLGTRVRTKMQDAEKSLSHKQHAEHTLEGKTSEMAEKLGVSKETKFAELTGADQTKVLEAIEKDTISKKTYGRKFSELRDVAEIDSVENAVGTIRRVGDNIQYDIDVIRRDPTDANKFIVDRRTLSGEGTHSLTKHADSSEAVGEFVRALRRGSYDIRNISEAPQLVKKPLGVLGAGALIAGAPLLGGAALAAIAGGLRAGLKKGSSEYATVNKDFLKDLGGVISGALQNVNIKVNVSGGGGGHGGTSSKAHSGGGGGHH